MIRPRSKWANGARVAARLQAFGAEIVFHDPFLDPSSDIARQVASEGWSQTELDELLERSRFVSLHARLTDDNRGMVGREEIAPMPAGAVLVNCARGGLLDYDALCDALDDGHLFGAAVDVFPEEPVPRDSRLLRSPHLVITPHRQAPARRPGTQRQVAPGDGGRQIRAGAGRPSASHDRTTPGWTQSRGPGTRGARWTPVVFARVAGQTGDVFPETAGCSAVWPPDSLAVTGTGPDVEKHRLSNPLPRRAELAEAADRYGEVGGGDSWRGPTGVIA
jgi:hypothetical protein